MAHDLQLQQDIAARLTADAFFATVAIRREYADEAAGDALLTDQILAALNGAQLTGGKCGLAISISSAKGKPTHKNGPHLLQDLTFYIQVTEHKALNRAADIGTLIRADACRDKVMDLLHTWSFNGAQSVQVLSFEEDDLKDADLRGWIIEIEATAQQPTRTEKCARPVITTAGNAHTLTSGTAEASIYYTTDGSLPTPTNGTLYSAPFSTGSVTIRAVATKSGLAASDTAQKAHTFISV